MNDMITRLLIALERIANLHKPCHMEGHYRTADVCDEHSTSGPANCLGCGKPSPCPTLREVKVALR